MHSKAKFTFICLILVLFSIAVVSAGDCNSTQLQSVQSNDSISAANSNLNEIDDGVNALSSDVESNMTKSDDGAINKNSVKDTSSNTVGASNASAKLNTKIIIINATVVKGHYFKICLKDQNNKVIKNATVTFKLGANTYNRVTNSKGITGLKILKDAGTYSMKVSFKGSEKYNSISNTFNLIVPKTTAIVIGNDRLLTNGYLRIYLKSQYPSAIAGKNLTITIGNKKCIRATNSEGIVILKPQMGTGKILVTVSFEGSKSIVGSKASKNVTGVKGDARNPFYQRVPMKKGVPDVDYMLGYYVMGDPNAKYTILKSQYLDVIKRDSHCLYLNNKLTKYTVFKTKSEPNLNHIVRREKWNVIEREINTKVVLKNKYGYWPSQITVDLKGRYYTYSEVRDVQNTGYTCGPTSCSMCTQVLRNYVNEWQMAKAAGSDPYYGSSTSGLKSALESYNMKCSYFYKSSWTTAVNALKKGGCALVFHTWNHYVCILDISKDGKKVLVGNPSGDYNTGSHAIPTKWLTVKYMYGRFNNYDTSGLIVKLKYTLSKTTKSKINHFYSNMGKWTRSNTDERIPQID